MTSSWRTRHPGARRGYHESIRERLALQIRRDLRQAWLEKRLELAKFFPGGGQGFWMCNQMVVQEPGAQAGVQAKGTPEGTDGPET